MSAVIDKKALAENAKSAENQQELMYTRFSDFQRIFADPDLRSQLIAAGYKFDEMHVEGEPGLPMKTTLTGDFDVKENDGALIFTFKLKKPNSANTNVDDLSDAAKAISKNGDNSTKAKVSN